MEEENSQALVDTESESGHETLTDLSSDEEMNGYVEYLLGVPQEGLVATGCDSDGNGCTVTHTINQPD